MHNCAKITSTHSKTNMPKKRASSQNKQQAKTGPTRVARSQGGPDAPTVAVLCGDPRSLDRLTRPRCAYQPSTDRPGRGSAELGSRLGKIPACWHSVLHVVHGGCIHCTLRCTDESSRRIAKALSELPGILFDRQKRSLVPLYRRLTVFSPYLGCKHTDGKPVYRRCKGCKFGRLHRNPK